MNRYSNITRGHSGFTIVELLIVVVVIAILAAISLAAYTNFQTRARDSLRSNDMASIMKALDLYYVDNGQYPPSVTPTGSVGGGWEISNDVAAGRVFMQTLGEYVKAKIPIDPSNQGAINYRYISLNSGYSMPGNSCTINKPFYVLRVTYESSNNNPVSSGTAAATCGGEGQWVSTSTVRYIAPAQARM